MEIQSTGSENKLNIDSIPNIMPSLGTADSGVGR